MTRLTPTPDTAPAAAPDPTAGAGDLRAAGLRVTGPRLAVLREVHANPHSDVEDIARGVRDQLGSVSTQAVYDVVRALTAADLLRRIEPAGSPARYEAHHQDNHHHAVCRSCGAMRDIPCEVGEAPCLNATDVGGFVLDEAEVIYWGTCAACQPTPLPEQPRQSTTKEMS